MRSSGRHLLTDPKRIPKGVISKTFKNHQTSPFESLKPFKNYQKSPFKQFITMLSIVIMFFFLLILFTQNESHLQPFQNLADLVELEALNTPTSNNKVGDWRREFHRWMVFQNGTLYGILVSVYVYFYDTQDSQDVFCVLVQVVFQMNRFAKCVVRKCVQSVSWDVLSGIPRSSFAVQTSQCREHHLRNPHLGQSLHLT